MNALKQFFVVDVPPEYRADFHRENTLVNISRAKTIGIVFIILEVLMIIGALVSADWRWSGTPRSHYLIAYATMIIVQAALLVGWQWVERTEDMRTAHWLGIFSTVWMLAWSAGVSLLDQLAYPQVTVYVAGIFMIAITAYWSPVIIGGIYLLVETAFVLLLPRFQPSPALSVGHMVNTITIVIVAWALARLLYANRLRDFHLRMEIHAKNAELSEVNRLLQIVSSTDGLTQLLNRGTVEQRMELLSQECKQRQSHLAVIMVDLDAFKAYNDAYGHQAGDRALQQVAAVLQASVRRRSDLVGRYGGEEFIIAMPQEEAQEASVVAERIRSGVEALSILHRLSPTTNVLTVSVGFYSTIPGGERPLELIIRQADRALYQAKAAKGNLALEYC